MYSQEENKNIDDAWRHGVRSLVFSPPRRGPEHCRHGCHRAIKWSGCRGLVGECLMDITSTTDGQSQLFWTWPCWMCGSCLLAYVFFVFFVASKINICKSQPDQWAVLFGRSHTHPTAFIIIKGVANEKPSSKLCENVLIEAGFKAWAHMGSFVCSTIECNGAVLCSFVAQWAF